MDAERPEIKGFSIALLGDFNPKIFQPAWFSAQHLIRGKEYETPDIRAVHNEIVDFGLGWRQLQEIASRGRGHRRQALSGEEMSGCC